MQQQVFYNVDHIPVMCCNLRYFTNLHESDLKVQIFHGGNVLMVVNVYNIGKIVI